MGTLGWAVMPRLTELAAVISTSRDGAPPSMQPLDAFARGAAAWMNFSVSNFKEFYLASVARASEAPRIHAPGPR